MLCVVGVGEIDCAVMVFGVDEVRSFLLFFWSGVDACVGVC